MGPGYVLQLFGGKTSTTSEVRDKIGTDLKSLEF
jgi:hypothetical protein